jgi:alkylation response protein AidB-like acyl-CoA dehydrogenase
MDSPGISVKPIITIAGDHEVNQVFFDNVRIPVTNLVGPENEGWKVAKYLLEFERGGSSVATRLQVDMAELQLSLRDLPKEHELIKRTARTAIEVTALSQMEANMQAKVASGQNPGAGSSLMKIMASSLGQQIATLRMEARANYSIPHNNQLMLAGKNPIGQEQDRTVTASYLNTRASSIFGGAREVQKNIIAKSVLGL